LAIIPNMSTRSLPAFSAVDETVIGGRNAPVENHA
jgi:hypothetical protein